VFGKDFEMPAAWYRTAADHALADAMYNLGNMDENGLGAKQHIKKAAGLSQKAAQLGDAYAKVELELGRLQHSR
jgi:TPR repeat protein